MTVTYTDEMWDLWYKIRPYLFFNNDTGEFEFKEGTPDEIIEMDKKFSKLYDEQYQFELSLL